MSNSRGPLTRRLRQASRLSWMLAGALVLLAGLAGAAALASGSAQAQAQASPPVNTSPPTISGTPALGQTLTASSGSWSGDTPMTFAYQWQRCDTNGANCSDLPGATGATYVVDNGDVGFTLRVRVTATNTAGQASEQSSPTAIVTATQRPVNTAEPTISGTPQQGQTLTASTGTWSGSQPITYSYQWVRCPTSGGKPDGSDCTFIPGATGSKYTLQGADVGFRMRVRVTATNSGGSATVASNATDVVTAAPSTGAPVNKGEPTISGTPQQGQTLTASTGTWSGSQPITYSYQWVRCPTSGGKPDGSDCTFIPGATGSKYTLQGADVGFRMRVRVTATNSGGSATVASNATAVVQAAPPPGPAGAVNLPNGRISIPVSSVSLPARLIVDAVQFTPNPVRSRLTAIQLRAHIADTRGYVVRDALVFARSVPLLTTTPPEGTTGQDGWVTLSFLPKPDFPLKAGHNVQFFVRARKPGDNVLAGVSTRRLIQVGTARP